MPKIGLSVNILYEGKVKSSRPNLRETRDKRFLVGTQTGDDVITTL